MGPGWLVVVEQVAAFRIARSKARLPQGLGFKGLGLRV